MQRVVEFDQPAKSASGDAGRFVVELADLNRQVSEGYGEEDDFTTVP
jgi:hypothetical protein